MDTGQPLPCIDPSSQVTGWLGHQLIPLQIQGPCALLARLTDDIHIVLANFENDLAPPLKGILIDITSYFKP